MLSMHPRNRLYETAVYHASRLSTRVYFNKVLFINSNCTCHYLVIQVALISDNVIQAAEMGKLCRDDFLRPVEASRYDIKMLNNYNY